MHKWKRDIFLNITMALLFLIKPWAMKVSIDPWEKSYQHQQTYIIMRLILGFVSHKMLSKPFPMFMQV